eukprot:PhM_4_TR18276/c0_g1_i1/m.3606
MSLNHLYEQCDEPDYTEEEVLDVLPVKEVHQMQIKSDGSNNNNKTLVVFASSPALSWAQCALKTSSGEPLENTPWAVLPTASSSVSLLVLSKAFDPVKVDLHAALGTEMMRCALGATGCGEVVVVTTFLPVRRGDHPSVHCLGATRHTMVATRRMMPPDTLQGPAGAAVSAAHILGVPCGVYAVTHLEMPSSVDGTVKHLEGIVRRLCPDAVLSSSEREQNYRSNHLLNDLHSSAMSSMYV